ncbi:MAG: ATP-binding protein [Caldilineaceae bacterium]|nr:ATP-binding protein [Caldilineaceae bacterium]MDE0338177.1 ATP-binding protein [Caldilineaceae bacterium]
MTASQDHDSRLVHLVDELCQLSGETEWVEFKRNYHSAQMIGEYISALANAACLKYKPKAYLLYGIQDETHEVVGTSFDPYTEKGKGNQDLLPWITAGLACRCRRLTMAGHAMGMRILAQKEGVL